MSRVLRCRPASAGRGQGARPGRSSVCLLLLTALLLGGLAACQSRSPTQVRIDIDRAMQAFDRSGQPAPVKEQLPQATVVMPPDSLTLPSLESPPPAETVSRRRQAALSSIDQQRDAVRQRLLNVRLQNLPELEQRWEAELRARSDIEALLAERDAEWQEAFQRYGRQRFPLLLALAFAAPDSETYRRARAQLEQLDRAWQAEEHALNAAYQAQLERLEQEITVRVNARRREFVRNAELETLQQLAQQPDPAELYLPQPQPLPPAPARKVPSPAFTVRLPERSLSAPYDARRARAAQLRRQMLTQLAEEWAQTRGYQLTNTPSAPDRTDEFIRYLLAR